MIPIIISGTTGETQDRRFAQFWGTVKVAGQDRMSCLASMEARVGSALSVDPQCPIAWHGQVWRAFELLTAGGLPEANNTVVWSFGRPTFTPIEVEADPSEVALFDGEDIP